MLNSSKEPKSNVHKLADFRLALSQWETSLQSNIVSHWLGINLESALINDSAHSEFEPFFAARKQSLFGDGQTAGNITTLGALMTTVLPNANLVSLWPLGRQSWQSYILNTNQKKHDKQIYSMFHKICTWLCFGFVLLCRGHISI